MSDPTITGARRPVAYKDESFLDSPDAREIRILSEYLHPLSHFRDEKIHDTVVFFGSARLQEDGPLSRYYREARELAAMVTRWSDSLPSDSRRFVVCTGGGPGIMEAANRGAADVGGKSIGLNIGLPFEQWPNPYITPDLSFEFHYFFMRKFWFAYPAKAMVVFPGGFGTLDEFFEVLTLAQTQKLESKIILVLYGADYWREIINFDALIKHGMISPEDVDLFFVANDPETAFSVLQEGLTSLYLQPESPLAEPEEDTPHIAKSRI
ncbi:MAG TPA: TIGR00730 family Rossman fold protein [Bryobacteraceae bacterium]|nr:TIGR00730 family Rossman fold protein [Bryobacteraceae bacterium]